MQTSVIEGARAFALARHSGQTRKEVSETPYWKHLEEVASLVAGFGGDEEVVAAAWFHDTVEDCPPTSFAEIGAAFGPRVSAIVAEVTDAGTSTRRSASGCRSRPHGPSRRRLPWSSSATR